MSALGYVLLMTLMVGAAAAGWIARHRGWVSEQLAGPLSSFVTIVIYSSVAMLVVWPMRLHAAMLALPISAVVQMLTMTGAGQLLGKRLQLERSDHGVFVLACGLSNIGMTMGASVCWLIYGRIGLAHAQIYLTLWSIVALCVHLPLGKYFAQTSEGRSLSRTLAKNLLDVRMLPAAAVLVAIAMNLAGVNMPAWLGGRLRIGPVPLSLTNCLIGLAIALMYFTIGLRLHFGELGKYKKLYTPLLAVKFIIGPAIAVMLLVAAGLFSEIDAVSRAVILIEGTVPVALYSVLISNMFELNGRLGSLLFLVSTVAYLVAVLPLTLLAHVAGVL